VVPSFAKAAKLGQPLSWWCSGNIKAGTASPPRDSVGAREILRYA
jgi:hypothetical protein